MIASKTTWDVGVKRQRLLFVERTFLFNSQWKPEAPDLRIHETRFGYYWVRGFPVGSGVVGLETLTVRVSPLESA